MSLKLKKYYLNLIDTRQKNFVDVVLYFVLYVISSIYFLIVKVRNFLYTLKLLKQYHCKKKVISVGNISWGGTGKTTLVLYLNQLLSNFKVAVLRRGWGDDETQLIKEFNKNVFCHPNRVRLIKRLEDKFDVFILDDGFQYLALKKDLEIVMMKADEIFKKNNLIPAGILREPKESLKRANILIINHSDEIKDFTKIENLKKRFKHLQIYLAEYQISEIVDLAENRIDLNLLKNKPFAVLTAIGYPEGFIKLIKKIDLVPAKFFIYPDHYNLSALEFNRIQDILLASKIDSLLVTFKDKFHIPKDVERKLKIYVVKINLEIHNQKKFVEDLFKYLQIYENSKNR